MFNSAKGTILKNKPRKPWVAGLLTFFIIGLGHLYAGEAKRGIGLYVAQGLLIIILIPILIFKLNIFILVFTLFVGISYFIFCLVDAIKVSRVNKVAYTLKSYNKWYIYIGVFFLVNFLVHPNIETLIKENTIKSYKIPSGAMIPTLLIGDYILVNKFIYKIKKPQRRDVIVFKYPKDPTKDFVKRLIGVEGDTIEIKEKKLYVNNIEQHESYVIHKDLNLNNSVQDPRINFGPIIVPEDSLFFMGDNRDNSHDSRYWGFVKLDQLQGKLISYYWSWDKEVGKIRWQRIGKQINTGP